MKSLSLLLLLLFLIPVGFCPSAENRTMSEFCSKLQQTKYKMQALTNDTNLVEMPDIVIEKFNEGLREKESLKKALAPFNGIVFSMHLVYNNNTCFEGSLLMNDSEFEYIRFDMRTCHIYRCRQKRKISIYCKIFYI